MKDFISDISEGILILSCFILSFGWAIITYILNSQDVLISEALGIGVIFYVVTKVFYYMSGIAENLLERENKLGYLIYLILFPLLIPYMVTATVTVVVNNLIKK